MIMSFDNLRNITATGLHTILYGPPGTGKTTLAQTPDCYSITLTSETPAAEGRGHYIPEGSKFTWHHGPMVRAWLEGKRLILNELDQASGDMLTFLYVLLDDPAMARMTLPTGETIKPIPGFQAVATTNQADLASALPAALLDRFSVRICVDAISEQALARLTVPVRNLVSSTLTLDDDRRVSYRQGLTYDNLRTTLQDPKLAAQAVFGERSADIFNSIMLSLSSDTVEKKGKK